MNMKHKAKLDRNEISAIFRQRIKCTVVKHSGMMVS